MKKVNRFFQALADILSRPFRKKYTYYLVTLEEDFPADDMADHFVSSYLFSNRTEAIVYSKYIRSTTRLYKDAWVERITSDRQYTCVRVNYPQHEHDKVTTTKVLPE